VVCRQLGGDPCLALFPAARFEARLQQLETMREGAALGVGAKAVRAYLRKLRMSATPLTPDKQGRITLTEEQCRLAGISKDVAFVGAGEHAELWAPERLERDDDDADFTDLAGRIFG
jgi:MraZ protein